MTRTPRKQGPLLRSVRIDPALGGERTLRLPFLSAGPVEVELRSPLTFLIGENGSGKTTLLEAVAARCAIRPGGGRSYAETEHEREATAISAAVEVTFAGRRPKGLFLRADRFADTMARAGRLPMPATGEWRLADEQSRGEGVLSLLTARVDASEGLLFILGRAGNRAVAAAADGAALPAGRVAPRRALAGAGGDALAYLDEPPRQRPAVDRRGRHRPAHAGRNSALAGHAAVHG